MRNTGSTQTIQPPNALLEEKNSINTHAFSPHRNTMLQFQDLRDALSITTFWLGKLLQHTKGLYLTIQPATRDIPEHL